jgi:hypothetical protein
MLVKASLAAAALIAATAICIVDWRDVYNEMYPVNALKRDAFGICHESDPTFIRARQIDREGCFDRMPNSIALAIGWVNTGRRTDHFIDHPGGFPSAEALLAGLRALPTRRSGARQYAGEAQPDCVEAPRVVVPGAAWPSGAPPAPQDRLAGRARPADDPALVALGLAPAARRPAGAAPSPTAAAAAARPSLARAAAAASETAAMPVFEAMPSVDLGDSQPMPMMPLPAARGCRTPA